MTRGGEFARAARTRFATAVIRLLRRAPQWTLAAAVFAFPALGQQPADPQELFEQLNRSSIDPSEVYVIRNARISRDRVNVYLNRGFIAFLAPVGGQVTGAVFEGDGEVLMIPRDRIERASLTQFTKAAILNERFRSAYFRFTDSTARELMKSVRRPEPDDPEQPEGIQQRWGPILQRLNPEYAMRVLLDLTGARDKPCFLAYLQSPTLGIFQVEVDERFPEAVRVGAVGHAGNQEFADLWCAFPSAKSERRFDDLWVGSFLARSFRIDTRINPDHTLEARAELALESRSSEDRIVVLELSRFLKITEVQDEGGAFLDVLQNPGDENAETVRRGSHWIAVVLPKPYPLGTQFKLRFAYQGSVISDAGNGVLHVGERANWYPNRGVRTRADFDLTFQYPERLTLVATGDCVEESTSDGWKRSRWKSSQPQPVAGFNLGEYRSAERDVGGIQLQVFATREVEAALEKAANAMRPVVETTNPMFPGTNPRITLRTEAPPPLNPASRLANVADLAAETVSRYEQLFGPLQARRLAVTQVPGHFGQGWPGLVYLPTMVFLPRDQRNRLGFDGRSDALANEILLAHEIAHQWWGIQVGWKTYRDQWISEGFATYSAALQLASEKDGESKLRELLRQYKTDLLSKTSQGVTVESGGPIYLGYRLSNSQNPQGFNDIIYKKSCWVLHMLRELMATGTKKEKETFFTMLRDFAAAFQGREASTQDFVLHAEKYMTPAMDLERNRRLEWFFDDWVFGTGIPEYQLSVSVKKSAARKFVISGKIRQSGVPADFEMPVPLVARYSRDRIERLGWVVVSEAGGQFRFTVAEKPERVAIDEDRILAVVD